MITFLYLSALVSMLAIPACIIYGTYATRQDKLMAVRKAALEEATEALQSLARTAANSAATALKGQRTLEKSCIVQACREREYYYDRSARIVASIPVVRL